MPGLGTSFGRGGATTPQWDLRNADCIVIQGSNMAENHPVAFRFVVEARERGATVVHVDPRYTRTSALADTHVPIRSGTDVAFLGGLIHQVLEREAWFREYVLAYTNAATILRDDFVDAEETGGVFSGFTDTPDGPRYDPTSWLYRGVAGPAVPPGLLSAEPFTERSLRFDTLERDETLNDPRCVLNVVRRHFARYTPELVERVCGVPAATLVGIADTLIRNSGRERTTAWCYAVGWTQHTVGVQIIRAAAILQLLLGNVGRPGGGILALRGHATIQGSTDIPTLYNLLPGYLPMPDVRRGHDSLADYLEREGGRAGWWANLPAYVVSLLRAWFPGLAPDEAFAVLPRIAGDHSQLPMTLAMADGEIEGLFVLGQNPFVGGHNRRVVESGLARLRWLVVRDLYETETAAFWQAPGADPRSISTEVFFLPAAAGAEKDGSYTNTHRLVQWHDRAVPPPGEATSELAFVLELGSRLKAAYARGRRARDRGIRSLGWDHTRAEDVLREINGARADGSPVDGFADLRDDGSTSCGCWIYSGVFAGGVNRARSREPGGPNHLGWGFAWPTNRRMLYNRASADPNGRAWSARKRYLEWDAGAGRWVGPDVPDFPVTKPPNAEPVAGGAGLDAHSGAHPFVMLPDGVAWLYAPVGLRDGPLPTHYEPVESPVPNPLYPDHPVNPVAKVFPRRDNPYHAAGDARFPHVLTTYRVTEHHTGGTMTRYLPWLAELQPGAFVELDPDLAASLGVETLDWVVVETARGEARVRALVTGRLRPLVVDGVRVHQVGMPWHYGFKGIARGDVANTLTAVVGDPNVTIHEGKTLTCSVRPDRRPRR